MAVLFLDRNFNGGKQVKHKLRAAGLALAVTLAATTTKAREDCGTPKSPETPTSVDCTALQGDESAQNSATPQEKKGSSLLERWLRMTDKVEETQPDWLSPLATTSGRLKNEFRYDAYDQPAAGGNRQYQLGGNRGVELITTPRTQILLGVPTYTVNSPNGPAGGFGDLPLQIKFRIAAAERTEGNYLLTFILAATAPTGVHRYGSGDGVVTPTLAFGKGWGRFDVQSTVSQSLPAGHTAKIGRQFQWNTAFQYHTAWKLWPELETNATFYETGRLAGQRQLFLTPGLGFGRARLNRRFRYSAAVGMQIAATHFHTYDHCWIFSQRISF